MLGAADVEIDGITLFRSPDRMGARRSSDPGSAGNTSTSPPTAHVLALAARPPHLGRARDEALYAGERGLARAGRLVALDVGQPHGKLRLGDRHDAVIRTVDERDRLAPVALAREHPVAQPIADRALAEAAGLEVARDRPLGLGRAEAVERA